MNAADYAISISKQYNAELLSALHVIHPADVDLFGATGEISAAAYHMINTDKEAQKYLDNVKLKTRRIREDRSLCRNTIAKEVPS